MSNKCTNLKKLLDIEMDIIERHIDDHKWFNSIEDKEEAIADFIQKYAWIMKEIYCSSKCDKRDNCDLSKNYK